MSYNAKGLTSDDSHDEGMRDGTLDVQRLCIESLQFLVVLLLRIHLNLQRIHLQYHTLVMP